MVTPLFCVDRTKTKRIPLRLRNRRKNSEIRVVRVTRNGFSFCESQFLFCFFFTTDLCRTVFVRASRLVAVQNVQKSLRDRFVPRYI